MSKLSKSHSTVGENGKYWRQKSIHGQSVSCDDYAVELLKQDPYMSSDSNTLQRPPTIRRSSSLTDYGDDTPEKQPYNLRRRRTASLQHCFPNIRSDSLRKRPSESSFGDAIGLREMEWKKRRSDADFPFSAVPCSPKSRKRGSDVIHSPETFCRCICAIIVSYVHSTGKDNGEGTADSRYNIFDGGVGSNVDVVQIARQLCVSPASEPAITTSVVPSLSVSTVYAFLHNLFTNTQVEHECLLIMLVYIERALHGHNGRGLRLTIANWKAVLLTALMLASKVWDDFSMINVDFSAVCSVGGNNISVARLNALESRLLEALDYRVFITGPEYAQVHFRLQALVGRAREGRSSSSSAVSIVVKRPRLVRMDSDKEADISRWAFNAMRIVSPQAPERRYVIRDCASPESTKLVDIRRPIPATLSPGPHVTCPVHNLHASESTFRGMLAGENVSAPSESGKTTLSIVIKPSNPHDLEGPEAFSESLAIEKPVDKSFIGRYISALRRVGETLEGKWS